MSCGCMGWDGTTAQRKAYCATCAKKARKAYDAQRSADPRVRRGWADASKRWHSDPDNRKRKSQLVLAKYYEPATGVHFRISREMRYSLKDARKQGRSWIELVGYGRAELMAHLERQFLKGMSWENMGEWHIDHIVPLSSFTISGPDDPELRRAWSLPNLRPLWAKDNIRKGAKRELLV